MALSERRDDSVLELLTAADRLVTCADENSSDYRCRDGPHDSYNTRTVLYKRTLVILH